MDFDSAKKYILSRLENELEFSLYYHGLHHTIDVYEATIRLANIEGITENDLIIVKTAALYHDAGFLYQYEHNEDIAVKLAKTVLPEFDYESEQISTIGKIIMATKVNVTPQTLLEKIVCDADYDYLGRNDVKQVANTLYKELNEHDYNFTTTEWIKKQIQFLEKHQYYSNSAYKLRNEKKLAYFNYLKKSLNN